MKGLPDQPSTRSWDDIGSCIRRNNSVEKTELRRPGKKWNGRRVRRPSSLELPCHVIKCGLGVAGASLYQIPYKFWMPSHVRCTVGPSQSAMVYDDGLQISVNGSPSIISILPDEAE